MNLEERIISLYLLIEKACVSATHGVRLRCCGRRPELSDAEILTIEIFGQMQGCQTDASIWRYVREHWLEWFPKLGSYKAFVKQCANLAHLKQLVFRHLFPIEDNIHITDGVPMPVCHVVRAKRCKSFRGEAAFGYCAAKNERYYGFKGHVVIDIHQRVIGFTLTASNVDEREVMNNLRSLFSGMVIGDKGLLSKPLHDDLAKDGIDLQTPLRANMADPRPKTTVQCLMKIRRRVETVIGQLTQFFGFAHCRARDLWHLNSRLIRKLLAYNLTLS
jgi:hypothetical protein